MAVTFVDLKGSAHVDLAKKLICAWLHIVLGTIFL